MRTNKLIWLLLAVLSLIWGTSFILIKLGLKELTPLQLGSLRIVCAGIFVLLVGFRTLAQIPLHRWKFLALTGLCGNFIPAFLFAAAEQGISSTLGAVLNSLTPISTLVFGFLIFKLDIRRNQIFGVLFGFIGCLLLVLCGEGGISGNVYYALLVVIATVFYALNVHFIKRFVPDLSPLAISTGNFAVMTLPALAILWWSGYFEVLHLPKVQQASLFIAVLGVMSTAVASVVFYKLIQLSTPVFASSVTYLIPIVAAFWGLLANETLTIFQMAGAGVVLFGVYLSSRK